MDEPHKRWDGSEKFNTHYTPKVHKSHNAHLNHISPRKNKFPRGTRQIFVKEGNVPCGQIKQT